jgi:hypothetical protein
MQPTSFRFNRIRLRDGSWLEEGAVLRRKSDEKISPASFPQVFLYARAVLPGGSGSNDFQEVGFADFLDFPEMEMVDFAQFSGRKGSRILVLIAGDASFQHLELTIRHWDGSLALRLSGEQGLFPTEWAFTLPEDLQQAWSRMLVSAS